MEITREAIMFDHFDKSSTELNFTLKSMISHSVGVIKVNQPATDLTFKSSDCIRKSNCWCN